MSAKGTSMPQGHSGVLRHLACGFACASISAGRRLVTRPALPPTACIAHDLPRSRQRAAAAGAGRYAGAAPGDPARARRRPPERRYGARPKSPTPPGGPLSRHRRSRRRRPHRRPAPRRRRNRRAATARSPAPIWTAALNDIRDRGKLRQFMRRLGREAPDPAGPQTLAQAVGLADPPAVRQAEAPWAAGTCAARILRGLSVGHVRIRRGSQRLIQCRSARATGRAWRNSRSRRIVLGSAPTTVIAWTPA